MKAHICKGTYYDIKTTDGGIAYAVTAVVYALGAIYLILRFIRNIIRSRPFVTNVYSIILYIFIIIQFLLRSSYYAGAFKPLCFSYMQYEAVGDYPSLAQTISIIALSLNYINTIESIRVKENKLYKVYKIFLLVFIIAYCPLFIVTNTAMGANKDNETLKNLFFGAIVFGQTLTFASFTILACILGGKLKEIYSETSKSVRAMLYIFSVLLFTRLPLAVINITGTIEDLRKDGFIYIYAIASTTASEIVPTLLLLALSSIQVKEDDTIEAKVNLSEIINPRDKGLTSSEKRLGTDEEIF